MKNIQSNLIIGVLTFCFAGFVLTACKKDGNPNNLPSVSPADYAGTIDGFKSSDEIFANNLVAYWSFDDTKNELKSGKAPTLTANDAFINGGVRGKAISLNAGFLQYATQFNAFKTDSLQSFTISLWVQVLNNGSKKTQLFTIARPGTLVGNVDLLMDTDIAPASNVDYIRIRGYFATVGGGRQDNINAFGAQNRSPQFGANKWVHLVYTYDRSTGVFNIWGDGEKIGNYPNRGTAANNLFKSWEPSSVIIGGNYNTIPGQSVSGDNSFAAMTGSIDEIRVYNTALPNAFISALYNLGKAGK
jgi:hypothetical protein